MDSVEQLEKDLREATKELVVDCLALLAKQGIHHGARVTKDGQTYSISRIEATMRDRHPGLWDAIYGPRHAGLWDAIHGPRLAVYGYKLLRDKSWGTHTHYIGRPHELNPCPL